MVTEQLSQRGQRRGLLVEHDQARAAELGRDVRLRGRHHHGLVVRERESGGIGGDPLHVVAAAGHRDADQAGVHALIGPEHRQHLAEQAAVGEQRGGDVNRIGLGREGRQRLSQRLGGDVSEPRELEPVVSCRVGAEHADRTGVTDHGKPTAVRLPVLQVELGRRHEIGCVTGLPDAAALEEGIDDTPLAGQRAGM